MTENHQTFYAVLYAACNSHNWLTCSPPDFTEPLPYALPQKPYILDLKIEKVYCVAPKFTRDGKLAKANRYRSFPTGEEKFLGAAYSSAHGEFFVTEEEARARYLWLKAENDAQEAELEAMRETSRQGMRAAMAEVYELARRLPDNCVRITDSEHLFRVNLTTREVKALDLAFPNVGWSWCGFHVSPYPRNFREFSPELYIEHMQAEIENVRNSLELVVNFFEQHGESLRTIFGSFDDSEKRELVARCDHYS